MTSTSAEFQELTRKLYDVNFFNLVNEGEGWKIINIAWDNERPGVSLQDAGLL